jgi:phage-related protein
MAMNTFTFNGTSSADFGLLVNGLSTFGAPTRRVQKFVVPGRSGDIIIDDGTYDNYIARYEIAVIKDFKINARAIANWLLSAKGYLRLEDTYNTDSYRMAACYTNIEYFVTSLIEAGSASIDFDCKPQRWLKSGENPLGRVDGDVLTNPSQMPSKPFMRIYGTGVVTLGNYSFEILSNSSFVDIDCETMQIYRGTTLLGNTVTMNEFPQLESGTTTIGLASGITSFSITPRWWTL